jgi:hypothetical protein
MQLLISVAAPPSLRGFGSCRNDGGLIRPGDRAKPI